MGMQGKTKGIYNLVTFLWLLLQKDKFAWQKSSTAPCIAKEKMVLFYTV